MVWDMTVSPLRGSFRGSSRFRPAVRIRRACHIHRVCYYTLRMQQVRSCRELYSEATRSAFLDQCCDPVYGGLVWLEGPTALGWHLGRECEQKYAYGLVERFITALVDAGYLADRARGSLVRFSFWMLGGAGLALAEAAEADRSRLREEWRYLIGQTISGLRASDAPHGTTS